MDQTRQIRFLIPPFILYGSLLWGLYWSDPCHNRWRSLIENSDVILPYLSIAVASVLPLGFLIGTISVLTLKLRFLLSDHTYETCVSTDCLSRMKKQVGKDGKEEALKNLSRREKKLEEHLTEVTFNHGVLKKEWPGVHTWLVRRWNAFNVSAHCVCAVVLAFFLGGPVFGLRWSWQWGILSAALYVFFFVTGWLAWRETMKMFEFQAMIDCKPVEGDKQVCSCHPWLWLGVSLVLAAALFLIRRKVE